MKTIKTKKRFGKPHRKYWMYSQLCKKIKQTYFDLKNDEWFDDKKIHKKLNSDFGVPLSTIYRWTWKWQSDMNWDPADTSVHGDFNRIFTDEQENSVVSFIKENYIDEGNYFSGIHFQSLMFDAYDDAFRHEEETPEFSCSTVFLHVWLISVKGQMIEQLMKLMMICNLSDHKSDL